MPRPARLRLQRHKVDKILKFAFFRFLYYFLIKWFHFIKKASPFGTFLVFSEWKIPKNRLIMIFIGRVLKRALFELYRIRNHVLCGHLL